MKAIRNSSRFLEHLRIGPQNRKTAVVILLSYLLITAILVLSNHLGAFINRVNPADYEVGQVAEHDLVSDRNLVYTDSQATKERADQAASEVPPVFQVDSSVKSSAMGAFNDFAELATKLYTEHETSKTAFQKINSQFPRIFSATDVKTIMESPNLLTTISIAANSLQSVLSNGIVGNQAQDFGKSPGSIKIVRNSGDSRNASVIPVKDAVTMSGLSGYLGSQLGQGGLSAVGIGTVVLLVSSFAREDAFYDYAATQASREKARQSVEPVVQRIAKGEKILKKGFVISRTDMDKISALADSSKSVGYKGFVGTALLILVLYALAITLLNRQVIHRRIQEKYLYLLIGLAVFYVAVTAALTHTSLVAEWLPYAVLLPTALVSMIVTILIDTRVGVMFSLLISLTLFAVSSLTPFSFLFAFLSGVTSTFVVAGAERRIDLIRASIEIAVANSVLLVVFGFTMNYEFSWFMIAIAWGALNGFLCGILNLGLLPIFEHLLNAPTPFRLMELSDMNSPMLKRMLTLAPGTYGHSVSVANLAESACRAIGANALLARVGAYYHDIGKIDQSEYFIENQTSGNVHDELKPSLSVAVIKSHVKIGIERAKELGLPQEVIDIIAQHHGSGLISYFYIQALKSQKDSKVQPEDFSYSGVPPTSREAAVVMLADTIEAASRTLKKPTAAKLERFIWTSIIDRFTSGQMNDSDLTFRDLEVIKKTFLQILAGHFHSRIEYPDKPDRPDKKEAIR